MSVSGRRMTRVRPGPPKPKKVARIRRTREQAYTSEWDVLTALVRRRDGNRCRDCGRTDRPMEVHHVIPVSKGGPTILLNLRLVCDLCHAKKPKHGHLFKERTLKRMKVRH